jgi:hypothetical protein
MKNTRKVVDRTLVRMLFNGYICNERFEKMLAGNR